MALDQVQEKATKHVNGAAMILAGPGSGKTTVITHRIWNLIKENLQKWQQNRCKNAS